jgi:hypothetical protein
VALKLLQRLKYVTLVQLSLLLVLLSTALLIQLLLLLKSLQSLMAVQQVVYSVSSKNYSANFLND